MKIGNWCKKLSATLVAAGIAIPTAANAAPTGTNLVVNPGFENVNINSSQGGYRAVEVLDWTDGSKVGFAYSHDGSLNGGGMPIPDYANGGPLAGGGSFYFTSNASPGDVNAPGQVTQRIDLSTGPTAAAIPTGGATFSLSAFFSSYSTNGDLGNVHVEFFDAPFGGASVGPPILITDNNPTTWTQVSTSGLVPPTALAARISVYGSAFSGGPDGYIDNVSFSIVPEPSTAALVGLAAAAVPISLRRRRDV
jgi:hypothetical protein